MGSRITSKQALAAYSEEGSSKLVAGDPETLVDVSEIWVFERGFGKNVFTGKGLKWRLAARL